jgi:hypothetical protein
MARRGATHQGVANNQDIHLACVHVHVPEDASMQFPCLLLCLLYSRPDGYFNQDGASEINWQKRLNEFT